jgi:hypothetical protein
MGDVCNAALERLRIEFIRQGLLGFNDESEPQLIRAALHGRAVKLN